VRKNLGSRSSLDRALLEAARRPPVLTPEEERDLARRASDGDEQAASVLVESHLRFVIRIAERYRNYGLAMADLVQEGCVGLVQAVRKFDPEHHARLSTYAVWWIRAAIQDHVMRSWSLVRIGTTAAQKSLFFNFRRMKLRLDEGGETLSEAAIRAIAARLRVSERDVRKMEARMSGRDRSLDIPTVDDGDEGDAWVDRLPDEEPDQEQRIISRDDFRAKIGLLAGALAELTARELLVIRRRYLSEASVTLESLGREMGVSKERVRQIEAQAMAKLRAFMMTRLGEGAPA